MTATEAHWLADATLQFRKYKTLADGALAQVADADLFRTIDAESNSIALLVKHVSGNLLSRWSNFRTTDGEKPDRDRDREFERPAGPGSSPPCRSLPKRTYSPGCASAGKRTR